jgi:hypothetical protein
MPLTAIKFDEIKPNTPDGKLIWVDRHVTKPVESIEEEHYEAICKYVVSGIGWYVSEYPIGIPNPYNLTKWEDARWPESRYATTPLSFAEITDMRTAELITQFEGNDLPIVVSYSGGIDSTVIVAAMCKHFSRDMLDRVVLKMNNTSIFESPAFFKNVIQAYGLKYTDELKYDWENSNFICGDPGDPIWITATLIEMSLRYNKPHLMDAQKNPDALIEWLTYLTSKETADWFYQLILYNAHRSGFQIETYEDFFWWAKTSLAYGNNRINVINHVTNPWHAGSWELFKERGIPWFHTSDYRLYSSTNRNNGVKFDGTISSYKMPAKVYINELLNDPYYLKYKVKVNSNYNKAGRVAALYDDGTVIFNPKQFWQSGL